MALKIPQNLYQHKKKARGKSQAFLQRHNPRRYTKIIV